MDPDLPFVDEHQVLVDASAQAVWEALASQFSGPGKPAFNAYLRVIAAPPHRGWASPAGGAPRRRGVLPAGRRAGGR